MSLNENPPIEAKEKIIYLTSQLFPDKEEKDISKPNTIIEHANFTHKFSDYNIHSKEIIPLYINTKNSK